MEPSCPLWISCVCPAIGHKINLLLTKPFRSRWLDIGFILFCVFRTWSISSHLDLTVVTHMLYIAESGKKRTLRGRWLDVCPFRRIYNAYLQQRWNLECMPEEGRTCFYIKSPGADLGFPKRAPKAQASSGVRERAPSGNFLDFFSFKSPFQGFRVIQKGFQLGKCFFFLCKYIYYEKCNRFR